MEILFENPLATMYGPDFLVLFGVVIVLAVAALAVVKAQFDKTDRLTVPPIPPTIDPYEIAYLRGGNNEVARSVIFSLMQKGFIEIDSSSTPAYIKKKSDLPKTDSLNQIEQLTLGWLGSLREPKEIFEKGGLVKQLEVYGRSYEGRLEQQQLLVSEEDRQRFNSVRWTVLALILGLGGYKLLAAFVNENHNIYLLILFTVVGLILARAVSKLPRMTKLGKAYIERLQVVFENLRVSSQRFYSLSNYSNQTTQAGYAGYDPLLLSVGVFGAAVLAGTVYDNYNHAFERSQTAAASGSSGSCGSACGSSCSSSTGGDSGGSSCGGGCGGCGGGCS